MMPRFRRKKDEPEPEKDELSEEELLLQSGEALPDRAALSTLDADVAIPINPELAADVLSGIEEGDGNDDEGDEADEEGKSD